MMWAWVALAGALGAVARYAVHAAVQSRHASKFPYGTVVVNLTGSFVLGVLVGLVVYQGLDPDVRTLVGTMLQATPERFAYLLEGRSRFEGGATAPPWGLYLERVEYPSGTRGRG